MNSCAPLWGNSSGPYPRTYPKPLFRIKLSAAPDFPYSGLTGNSWLNKQVHPPIRGIQQSHGRRVRYAGLVINRQRPGTAKGVVFMTLEEETGFVNLVLWERVFQENGVVARTASFLGVTGTIQSQNGVVHLVVERCWEPRVAQPPTPEPSRDFH